MKLLAATLVSILLIFPLNAQQSNKELTTNTYIVTSSGDESDSDLEDGIFSPQTFRSAIENANHNSGLDLITFSNVTLIAPSNQLPVISDGVVIDGLLNDNKKVIIDGGGIITDFFAGLVIGPGGIGSGISNISLVNFSLGALLINTDFVEISNCLIGTPDGELSQPNGDQFVPQTTPAIHIKGEGNLISDNLISGNFGYGIHFEPATDSSEITIQDNIIGLDSTGSGHMGNSFGGILSEKGRPVIKRNIISDNGGAGIVIKGETVSSEIHAEISENYIGLDKSGTKERGNEFSGLVSERGFVKIEQNIISHNLYGIESRGDSAVIRGNLIGTDISGELDFGNQNAGIWLTGNFSSVGGDKLEYRNLISGNDKEGILINSFESTIQNNFVGVNLNGNLALGNTHEGIKLESGSSVVEIGNNVISGNHKDGIEISDSHDDIYLIGNLIGTDSTGTKPIGNLENGVIIENANVVTIGLEGIKNRNIISNNGLFGIHSFVTTTEPDTLGRLEMVLEIQNNFIGVDKSGNTAMGNGLAGISLASQKAKVFNNVISTNNSSGLSIEGKKNQISSNFIGSDSTGNIAMGNQNHGIELKADSNLVDGNLIVDNSFSGILIFGFSNGNTIASNLIGIDYDGSAGLGNFHSGVTIGTNSTGNFIQSNVISGNQHHGLRLIKDNLSTTITANFIGTDIEGKGSIPNRLNGILIKDGDDIDIGLPIFGQGNVISGNDGYGIELEGHNLETKQKGIRIRNNEIGVIFNAVAPSSNRRGGIKLDNTRKVTVGGKLDSFARNIIAGNDTVGVYIVDHSQSFVLPPDSISILGNHIGLDELLNPIPNNGSGIFVENFLEGGKVFIGKDSLNQRNVIAYNKGNGVSAIGERIVSMEFNEFYDNEFLAIDLNFDGVSLNDESDLDTGVNEGLNFPVISNAIYNKVDEELTIFSNLSVTQKVAQYFIDYYYNEKCGDSGFGEARYYLDSREVYTDANGFVEDSMTISIPYSEINHLDGIYLTTNTFSHTSGTSEFSNCFYLALKGSGGNKPDLVLTKTDSLETLEGSDVAAMFTYQIAVKNVGLVTAMNVTVIDTIPENLAIGEISVSKGDFTVVENVLTVEVDSLISGGSILVSVSVESTVSGEVINSAYVFTDSEEVSVLNNQDSDTTTINILVNTEESGLLDLPKDFELYQNYPNPFNPNTTISYAVSERTYVEISIFNLLGMKVATLVQEVRQPGIYTISWDASGFASDMYFYRMKTNNFIQTKKMTLIK